jgi:5S rRNA maturation endonuclease (ribonuclease M5)
MSERKIKRLTELLEKLARKTLSGTPIIVEGKKDVQALFRLNISGNTVTMKDTGKVLEDILEELKTHEVTVFVDFDEHGAELAREITRYMEQKHVKVNLFFWREIRSIVHRDVKDVEGLPSYLEKLRSKAFY